MRMLERRRARSTSLRIELDDGRRCSSLCIPAFKAAVAARECGGVWEAGGVREDSVLVEAMRDWRGAEVDGEGDGGSEFRSGGMSRGLSAMLWISIEAI